MSYPQPVYPGAAGKASTKGSGSAEEMDEFYRVHDDVFVEKAS